MQAVHNAHLLLLGNSRLHTGQPSSSPNGALQLGYSIYRTVVGYYSGEEDAYDMRKAMSRDIHKRSLKARKARIHPDELETD